MGTAKSAGVRYIILITKHHDGFHMWDTAFSNYKITNSPFKRDYVKEVVDACHAANMPIGLYFAQREFYHPDYNPTGSDPSRDHKKYIQYQFNAVRELLTKYGKIDMLWFDACSWSGMFKETNWDSEKLYRMARQLQPNIVINNRASIPGDFDTPEQHLGSFQNNRPWESCITMPSSDRWSYDPSSGPKSLKTLIQTIVGAADGDGNCLLNVGPRPDGTIQPTEMARLNEIGEWMKKYGHSIYGTRGGPFKNGAWGGSTHKGDKIWLHLMDASAEYRLPALPCNIKSSKVLTGGTVSCRSDKDALVVSVPLTDRDPLVTIVELTLDTVLPETLVLEQGHNIKIAKPLGTVIKPVSASKNTETVPSWSQVDLGKIVKITVVKIEGIKDHESLKNLNILLSEDGKTWTKSWTAPDTSGDWSAEMSRMQAGAQVMGLPARYIRFESGATTAGKLDIQKLTIYGGE